MSEQNIEFSSDENILIVKGGKREGEYQAKTDGDLCTGCNFWDGDFFGGCSIGGVLKAHCSPQTRKDGKSIIWIKKENTEMTKAPAPAPALQHRHFDLIVQWAKNPTQTVWMWSGDTWEKIGCPSWTSKHYVIGEKPTMPPVKMVKYDGGSIEFPEPLKEPPPNGSPYFFALLNGTFDAIYRYDRSHHHDRLSIGTIHMTREGALKQCEALQELLKNQIKKWG